jgi:hypothetical protein
MAFSGTGRAEQQQVGALVKPAAAGAQSEDLGLAKARHGREVEGGEALAGRQAGVLQMALDAPLMAFGQFVLEQGGEEAGRRPALLFGAFGEGRPQAVDGGQPQFVQQQRQPSGIDGDRVGAGHGRASLKLGSSAS